MKVIWNKQYQDQFSTYDSRKWRKILSNDTENSISNWPPKKGSYGLEIRVFYKPGNSGLSNSDIDNAAKIVVDGVFGTVKSGTGPDRFLYEMSIVKARNIYDGLEVTLYDLQNKE